MIRFLIGMLLLLSMSCNSDKAQDKNDLAIMETKAITPNNTLPPVETPAENLEPYELKVGIGVLKNNKYELKVDMILNKNSFFVSPNSRRDFKGKFTFHIDETTNFDVVSNLMEWPETVEEYDPHPFIDGYVNWVSENTSYSLKIRPATEKDFRVMGYIQFTIEPRCTLEKIPVIIKNEGGVMKFEIFQC